MARQISERTRKVREIIERIPPEKINGTTPTDLQEEFEAAGVAPRNEQDMQTIYAEFSRRRRKLGLLKTQLQSVTMDRGIHDLDEMIVVLGSILPALRTKIVNGAIFLDYYRQLETTMVDNAEQILNWLKELQEKRK